jgi:hypothetical protein
VSITEIRKLVRRIQRKYTTGTAGCFDAHLCCDEILKALRAPGSK